MHFTKMWLVMILITNYIILCYVYINLYINSHIVVTILNIIII